VVVAPTKNRPGNSTRICTLLHCGLALLSSSIGLTSAVLNTLNTPVVDALLSIIIAFSQAIDGRLTWQRYLIVHNHKHPTKTQTILVYTFIFVCFCLPFLVAALFWGFEAAAPVDKGKGQELQPNKIFLYGGLLLYVFSIPTRLLWDTVLGCAVVTRIHEMRLLVATTDVGGEGRDQEQVEQQNETLLLVARKTVVYICISTSLNLFIHIPLTRLCHPLVPYIAVLTMLFNMTFALASHYCFNSRVDSAKVLLLLSRCFHKGLGWLFPEQQQQQQQYRRCRSSPSYKNGVMDKHLRKEPGASNKHGMPSNRRNSGSKGVHKLVMFNKCSSISEDTSEKGDGLSREGREEDEVEEERRPGESSIFLRGRETLIGSSRAFLSVPGMSISTDEEEGQGEEKEMGTIEGKEGEEEVEVNKEEEEEKMRNREGDDEDKNEEEEKDKGDEEEQDDEERKQQRDGGRLRGQRRKSDEARTLFIVVRV